MNKLDSYLLEKIYKYVWEMNIRELNEKYMIDCINFRRCIEQGEKLISFMGVTNYRLHIKIIRGKGPMVIRV